MCYTMAFYQFKSSVLAPEGPAIELEFNMNLHVGQKFVSETETSNDKSKQYQNR